MEPSERFAPEPSVVTALALASPVGVAWNYFDEKSYVDGGRLRPGEDPYNRNKFNQAASDQLASNRDVPDTRHQM